MFQKSSSLSKLSRYSAVVGMGMAFALCQSSTAKTLCVGQSGCSYSTISSAVYAASSGDTIQVQPGIYSESVVINKRLSLIGAGRGSTIINALGQPNGILVDGSANQPLSGISGVVISGFTVQNANFEGILVMNASLVTITANQISGNDRSYTASSAGCPNLPAFETNESEDCGEGLHLMGVDHSVIANNNVMNNAGGILITDETGPTHDNLISGNNVSNNIYDCGITMASHSPAPSSGQALPGGVYHNTVYGNTAKGNGIKAPGGAGIGIFAPGPGSKAYGNVVVNNSVSGNGLPGIAMHNHAYIAAAPPVNLNDNMIVGNQLSGNAADSGDSATPGTAGINLYSVAPVTGTIIAQNSVQNEQIGIAVNTPGAEVLAPLNNLPVQTGLDNLGSATIYAGQNFWGCAAGPGNTNCAGFIGMVLATSWAVTPF